MRKTSAGRSAGRRRIRWRARRISPASSATGSAAKLASSVPGFVTREGNTQGSFAPRIGMEPQRFQLLRFAASYLGRTASGTTPMARAFLRQANNGGFNVRRQGSQSRLPARSGAQPLFGDE